MHGRVAVGVLTAVLFLVASSPSRASWVQSVEADGIAYFLHDSPAQIQRYDMTHEQWLSAVTLSGVPTALAVDYEGIYVALGQTTVRLALDGTGQVGLHNTGSNVSELIANGDYLYLIQSSGFVSSIQKLTGTLVDSEDYWYSMRGVSIAPTVGKLFARNTGVSPSDIVQVVLGPGGSLGAQNDSPYHGDLPGASRTFVFPGEARVGDTSGIVYSTNDLSFNNSLVGSLDDVSFYGDLPIVLRGNTLFAYNNAFFETGQHTLEHEVDRIFVRGENVYGFFEATPGVMDFIATPVNELSPAEPGEPVDPNGLAYVPDHVVLGNDGVVYLLSGGNLGIFRWSIAGRGYLPTIPLASDPSFMAYSPVDHRLYLAYPNGALTKIELSGDLTEVPFANSPGPPRGLATAGEYLFVSDSSFNITHYTYRPDGSSISQVHGNTFSEEYIWNEANRKMYFFQDGYSPNDIIWEEIDVNGVIGTWQDSPYHSSTGIVHPIRVAPDGSVVVLGSGRIYDALTLRYTNNLPNTVADAAWLDGQLFTLRAAAPYSQIQRWAVSNYILEHSFFVSGQPLRLFALEEELLVITSVGGVPRFWLRGPDAGDVDNDGVQDHLDNCPEIANPDQTDTDRDESGDACNDTQDEDGDEWSDALDNCLETPNASQANSDTDPLGDACDPYPLHDLRVVVEGPAWAIVGVPVELTFRLEDAEGNFLSDLTDVRVTVNLDGSAVFGTEASVGVLLDGMNTNHALVEFDDGFVVLEISDPIAETVVVGGEDTEQIGIQVFSSVLEDFELSDGGFVHSGPNDTWAHGVPTSGPGLAYSGDNVWATNLSGNYLNGSNCSLYSPMYRVPSTDSVFEFRSWFSAEFCCDLGYVEISANGGASWVNLDILEWFEGGYDLKTYSLSPFAGQNVIIRFRLTTDSSVTYPGWYVDDFQIDGLSKRVRFIALDGDEDSDGLSNAVEVELGTDPFDPDTEQDGALDGADNCPLTFNPDQANAVHPNTIGDACDDPDADGAFDHVDNCPDIANPDQLDLVHANGVGDACEDPEADGVFDLTDNCPGTPNPDQADGDGDAVGSACDLCPTTPNPSQTESTACMTLTEDGGPCLEAQVELIGEAVSGEVRIYSIQGTAPTSITFDILATSCSITDYLELRLNGELLGTVQIDPLNHCSCLSPIQHFTVDDAELLQSIWGLAGANELVLTKLGASPLSWVRARFETEDTTQLECIYSYGSTGCTLLDLCAAGYAAGALSHQFDVDWGAGLLLNTVPFENSQLPELVEIRGTGPASLCVFASAPVEANACISFTIDREQFVSINGAACDLPPRGTDLIVDFGPGAGVYTYYDDAVWSQLHDGSPEEIATGDLDGDGQDESVYCFTGPEGGIYVRSDADGWWPRLLSVCGGGLVTNDLDGNGQDDLIVDLDVAGAGLYAYYNNSFWLQLHDHNTEQMLTADIDGSGRNDLIVNFGAGPGLGLYVLYDGSSWVRLHALSPELLATGDLDGSGQDDLIVDFGTGFGLGLFVYHDDSFWTHLHGLSPDLLATGDLDASDKDDLIVDFGAGFGLYVYHDDLSWVSLHGLSPELLTTGDLDASGQDDLIVDFGAGAGLGLYVHYNDAIWNWLHPLSPELTHTGELNQPLDPR